MFRRDPRQLWKRHPAIARRVRLAFDCFEDRRTPAVVAADFAFAADPVADHGPATSALVALAPTATVQSEATGGDGPIEFLHPFCLISVGSTKDGDANNDDDGIPPLMPELSPAVPRSASTPPAQQDAAPTLAPREIPAVRPIRSTPPAEINEPASESPTLSFDESDDILALNE
jgi:hypothetical protein